MVFMPLGFKTTKLKQNQKQEVKQNHNLILLQALASEKCKNERQI